MIIYVHLESPSINEDHRDHAMASYNILYVAFNAEPVNHFSTTNPSHGLFISLQNVQEVIWCHILNNGININRIKNKKHVTQS